MGNTKLLPFPLPEFDETGHINIYYFVAGAGINDKVYTVYEKSMCMSASYVQINFHIEKRRVEGILITSDGWIPVDVFRGEDFIECDCFYNNDYVATNAEIPQNLFIPSLTRNFFLSKEEAEGVAEYLVNFKKEVVR